MLEKDWRTLLANIQRQNCILLLGPDIFDDIPEGPLTRQLAAELVADLEVSDEQKAELMRSELPAVARPYAIQQSRSDLEERTKDFYRAHNGDVSEIHEKLAEVPFYFTISSCHDKLYESALAAAGRRPTVDRYHFRGPKPSYVAIGTPRKPLVYHLYGVIDEPQSLVLTENDLLDFLVAVVSENPPLPSSIRSELQRIAKSFLFLGFGIRHWYLRILLHVLKFNRQESRSFALETLAAPDNELEQSIIFYRTGYRLEIYRCQIQEFVNELSVRCKKRGLTAETTEAAGPATAIVVPKVFISHTSEDGEKASMIFSAFRESGAEAWLDTENLEAGSLWNETIKARIVDADYFVILNSTALHNKRRGYINKEITLALGQQEEIRGLPYITPAQIDDSDVIPELSRFQGQPARNDAEIVKLVSTIKREFQLRGRAQ
ncbi:MAG TPA: toll/interleukin-1 receptor domain-containing protein [Thermoanaerobaculia bacterium]